MKKTLLLFTVILLISCEGKKGEDGKSSNENNFSCESYISKGVDKFTKQKTISVKPLEIEKGIFQFVGADTSALLIDITFKGQCVTDRTYATFLFDNDSTKNVRSLNEKNCDGLLSYLVQKKDSRFMSYDYILTHKIKAIRFEDYDHKTWDVNIDPSNAEKIQSLAKCLIK